MLGQRRRRWPYFKTTSAQYLVLAFVLILVFYIASEVIVYLLGEMTPITLQPVEPRHGKTLYASLQTWHVDPMLV